MREEAEEIRRDKSEDDEVCNYLKLVSMHKTHQRGTPTNSMLTMMEVKGTSLATAFSVP